MPNNELGDFQTPPALALQCLRVLGLPPGARVLEPTCGRGSFLHAAATLRPDSERVGIELQAAHATVAAAWGEVTVADVFTTPLADQVWRTSGPLFVIGNPPWVTSAELSRMGSANLPAKANLKNAKGLDALLGSSNFDVCEYIVLKALHELQHEPFTLGMLCKTQVARNVVEHAAVQGLPVASAALFRIDARKWFGAGVDACWFTVRVDPKAAPDRTCAVYDGLGAAEPLSRFGVLDGRLVSDVVRYARVRAADGGCPYEWRSGLKHDASTVFELTASPGPTSRDGQALDLESEYVFPLLKSTDVFRGRQGELTRWVIVPQQAFGAETASLAARAPKLWAYLTSHSDALDGRRSRIYAGRPRFSVFGHGAYTYAPFKVAVSGLHKQPVFRLVGPRGGQPVVLDDTCYFLPFHDSTEAAVVTALLSSQPCLDLIESLVFWDAKRPLTKKLLTRIDLGRLPVEGHEVLASAQTLAAAAGAPFDPDRASAHLQHLRSRRPQSSRAGREDLERGPRQER